MGYRRGTVPSKWCNGLALAIFDGGTWVIGLGVATWLRYALDSTNFDPNGLIRFSVIVFFTQVVSTLVVHKIRGRYHLGSVDEVVGLSGTTLVVALVVFLVNILGPAVLVPRSVPLTAALIALGISVTARLVVRRVHEHSARPDHASAQRVLVFGAGIQGQQIVRSMLSDRASGLLPVALLEDDPRLRHLRICGVPVLGPRTDLADVAVRTSATMLVVAVQGLDEEVTRDLVRAAEAAGLAVKVVPPLSELFRPWSGVSDLRDVNITDFLGRRPVETNVGSIAGYLTGKRVLVTGAGGSIGSELCRQIHRFRPAELIMLDRDESALHALQLSLYGKACLDSPDVVLGDIRDAAAIRQIFAQRLPQVVFHAAALKHLPMLEQYPEEAWKTNVVGTQNVLDAACTIVENFVNISTDKAANPVSMLGRSKRIGERLVSHTAGVADGTFLSVRFGNVLASRGSVLVTFAEQLAAGGPMTVTHPDVTRFFMTIQEAVQLVIQAGAIGRSGEALVLDMGEPVRIDDVARHLMQLAGKPSTIVYTGLRKGEKLHEELFGKGERDLRPRHPAISHVDVPPLDKDQVLRTADSIGIVSALVFLAGEPTVTQVEPALVPTTRSPHPANPASAFDRSRA